MNIKIKIKDLNRAMKTLTSSVSGKGGVVILGHVRMTAKGSTLNAIVTDLVTTLFVDIPTVSRGHKETSFTLPFQELKNIINSMGNEDYIVIEVNTNTDRHIIKSGNSVFILNGLCADDFPIPEQDDPRFSETMSAYGLLSCIEQTSPAMGKNDYRHYLNGVMLDFGRVIEATATNGHFLIKKSVTGLISKNEESIQVLVSRESVAALKNTLEHEGDVSVLVDERCIFVSYPGMVFASKLVDCKYPDCSNILEGYKDDVRGTMIVSRSRLQDSIKRVMSVSKDKSDAFVFSQEEDDVITTFLGKKNRGDSGEALDKLDGSWDKKTVFAVNPTYLTAALSAIIEAEVCVIYADPQSRVIIRGYDDGKINDHHVAVIMPIQI